MSADEHRRFMVACETVAAWPIYIIDTPGQSVTSMRSVARKMKKEKGIEEVYVDYIQLATGDQVKGGNREVEVSSIARGLKHMARELEVPVIALSQLSRSCETRGGAKIPILSDLRESGAIEQDADIVAFLYRAEYYNIDQDEEGNSTKGIAEIITAKNRHGALKTSLARFVGSRTRFTDLDTADMLIDRFSEPMDAFNPNISTRPDTDTDLPF
jgi:replicative DNA helicase